MLNLRNLWLALPLLIAVGCSKPAATSEAAADEGTGTPAVTLEETSAPAEEGAATSRITPENAKIEFVGTKDDGKHTGGFKQFDGTMTLNPTSLSSSRITVTIKTDSLWSDSDRLTAHLKNADFFETKTYPEAKFVSTSIKPLEGAGATHEITGDLTLHGVTKSLTFPATITVEGDQPSLSSEFTFKRTDYGINYSPDKVHDDVTVTVSVGSPKA